MAHLVEHEKNNGHAHEVYAGVIKTRSGRNSNLKVPTSGDSIISLYYIRNN